MRTASYSNVVLSAGTLVTKNKLNKQPKELTSLVSIPAADLAMDMTPATPLPLSTSTPPTEPPRNADMKPIVTSEAAAEMFEFYTGGDER